MADLEGDNNDNTITGGDDNDIIFGLGGDDILFGGDEPETTFGGDALFGGEGDDHVHGGAGDDHLEGNNGNNVVNGGLGDDSLINYGFETGNYDYTGGLGADSFFSLASGTTIVRDFDVNEGDSVRIERDDVTNADGSIRAEVIDNFRGFGPALFIDGENTDTYILSENASLDMLDPGGNIFIL